MDQPSGMEARRTKNEYPTACKPKAAAQACRSGYFFHAAMLRDSAMTAEANVMTAKMVGVCMVLF
jgi:hypothetical protein